jgi:hypothetical protein
MPVMYSDRGRRSIPAMECGGDGGSSELYSDVLGIWEMAMRLKRTWGRIVKSKSAMRSGHSLD